MATILNRSNFYFLNLIEREHLFFFWKELAIPCRLVLDYWWKNGTIKAERSGIYQGILKVAMASSSICVWRSYRSTLQKEASRSTHHTETQATTRALQLNLYLKIQATKASAAPPTLSHPVQLSPTLSHPLPSSPTLKFACYSTCMCKCETMIK